MCILNISFSFEPQTGKVIKAKGLKEERKLKVQCFKNPNLPFISLSLLFSIRYLPFFQVLPKDLQLCADRATGVDSLGQFQWGDMVQIEPQKVGVIVRLEKENFQVR